MGRINEGFTFAITGDFHIDGRKSNQLSRGMLHLVVKALEESNPDVVLVVGDMTDSGTLDATEVVAKSLGQLPKAKIPVIGVLGNHDYKGEKIAEKNRIYEENGITILDDELCRISKIGGNGDILEMGILGSTGGFDGSLYQGKKEHKGVVWPEHDLDKRLAAMQRLLDITPFAVNLLLTHFNVGPSTMHSTTDAHAYTSGSIRTEQLLLRNKERLVAAVHGHTHEANQTALVGSIDVICGCMQLSYDNARIRGKEISPHDYYYTHTVGIK